MQTKRECLDRIQKTIDETIWSKHNSRFRSMRVRQLQSLVALIENYENKIEDMYDVARVEYEQLTM